VRLPAGCSTGGDRALEPTTGSTPPNGDDRHDAAGRFEHLVQRLLEVPLPADLAAVFEPAGQPLAPALARQAKQTGPCAERHRDTAAAGGVPLWLQVAVWRRDGFRCRFCRERLVPNAVAWAVHRARSRPIPDAPEHLDRLSSPRRGLLGRHRACLSGEAWGIVARSPQPRRELCSLQPAGRREGRRCCL
jgi:hypothetical protein